MKYAIASNDKIINIISAPDKATAQAVAGQGVEVIAHTNQQKGWIKQGQDWVAPPLTFEQAKARKAAQIEKEFDNRYHADFAVVDKDNTASFIQSRDDRDTSNVQMVAQAANHKDRKGNGFVKFRTKDNVVRQFSSAAFADIAEAMFEERQEILYTFWEKRDEVSAAENQSELDAIDPATGWP